MNSHQRQNQCALQIVQIAKTQKSEVVKIIEQVWGGNLLKNENEPVQVKSNPVTSRGLLPYLRTRYNIMRNWQTNNLFYSPLNKRTLLAFFVVAETFRGFCLIYVKLKLMMGEYYFILYLSRFPSLS